MELQVNEIKSWSKIKVLRIVPYGKLQQLNLIVTRFEKKIIIQWWLSSDQRSGAGDERRHGSTEKILNFFFWSIKKSSGMNIRNPWVLPQNN